MGWLKMLNIVYEQMSGRFETSIANDQQRDDCFKIRKSVFGSELRRKDEDKEFSPAEVDAFDRGSTQLACTDTRTGQIVGTLRLTTAEQLSTSDAQREEYGMSAIPQELWPQTYVISRLAVLKDYRQTSAGLSLCLKCFDFGLDRDCRFALIVCEPSLFPMYRRLGFRILDRATRSPFGGYRLPLYLVAHDFEHLRRVKSPFWAVAKEKHFPVRSEGLTWLHQRQSMNATPESNVGGVTHDDAIGLESFLLTELSDKGRDQLLNHAVRIKCNYGDTVIAKGTGDRNMGFVASGALQVVMADGKVIVLGEGDIFGEMAFLLDIPRTADVTAATENTEIVLLSLSALNKLSDSKDQNQIWRNISIILAKRLIEPNIH